MPTTQEHRKRAENNLQFAQSFDLKTTPYIHWAVAAYFYAAVHWVDALLFHKEGINPIDHSDRRNYVKIKIYLYGIRYEYKSLYDRSIEARYECLHFDGTRVEQQVIRPYAAIERHILKQLPK